MTDIKKIKNIGAKTSEWLSEIGIHTLEDIEREGVVEVYKRLRAWRPDKVSLNALWGLQGAVLGIRFDQLPPDMKEDLKRQVDESARYL